MWEGEHDFWEGYSPFYGFRACEECVFNDTKALGDPFFRRFHHIPGLDWCIEHERPLFGMAGDEALILSPGAVLVRGAPAQLGRLSTGRKEWGEICGILLRIVRPLSNEDFDAVINERMARMFQGCGFSKRQKIDRQIEMKFHCNEVGQFLPTPRYWCNKGTALWNWKLLAFLLAVLYDSSGQVASELRKRGKFGDFPEKGVDCGSGIQRPNLELHASR